jgi:Nucleotide modification associated domain 2
MTKVYIYKLTVDDGGAPCVQDEVLSLAICKPFIRSTAQQDNMTGPCRPPTFLCCPGHH